MLNPSARRCHKRCDGVIEGFDGVMPGFDGVIEGSTGLGGFDGVKVRRCHIDGFIKGSTVL